jgi:uncharacterized protein YceK
MLDERIRMKLLTLCLLAITCICLTGCGTISSLSTNYDKLPQERKYVFSGVKQDVGVAFSSEADNHVPFWIRGGTTVDILFSAVADTYCLPYTIPKAMLEEKKLKEQIDADEQQPIQHKTP